MNLRQKYKKLKQENEKLRHVEVPVARCLPPYIETLGVRKIVTENELHVPPSYIENTEDLKDNKRKENEIAKMNWVISGAGFEENSPLADCNEKFDQSGSYSETDSDIADEISKTIRQVSMRVAETQDEFIFQTLRDFGLSTSNIVVEKEELVQAIQLIRMMKEYGIDIFERYNTATAQAGIFRRGYKEGLHDGIEKECSKVMDILEKGE